MTINITQIRTGRLAGSDQSYGIIYAPDKAMPGSMGALRDFLINNGLKAEPGYENSKHVLRVTGFPDDATLRKLLAQDFATWQNQNPIGVSGKIVIDRDVPILSLDKNPNEQKSTSFKAWLQKNATGLVGAFATLSGASMVMAHIPNVRFKASGEGGALVKKDINWKKGDVDEYTGKKGAKGTVSESNLVRGDALKKGEIGIRQTLFFASTAFVAAAALLFSFGFSKNRSMNELLSEADDKLAEGNEEAAFKEAENTGINKAYNWVKQNVWKIASPLNIIGGVVFTAAAVTRAVWKVKDNKEEQKKRQFTPEELKEVRQDKLGVTMAAAAGVTGFMAQFLILLMPKSKVAGFGGLDTYVANQGNKATQDEYKEIESDITNRPKTKNESKSKAFFQKHQMKIASRLSIISNFFFGGIPAAKKISNPKEKSSPKEKFFYGVFVNNMFADYFTGLSVPSSSHAPEYVYSTLAAWVDKKLPKDATAERTDEFIMKASKWLASQSEVQMKPEDIAKGVKTTLHVQHGRQHCETDVDIAAKLAQLQVVSPFASPSRPKAANKPIAASRQQEVVEKPGPAKQEAEESKVVPMKTEQKATEVKEKPLKELAQKEPTKDHGSKVTQSREEVAERPQQL
jgi:hypothetical protein